MRLYFLRGDLDFHWLRSVDNAPWPWQGGVPVEASWEEPSLTFEDEPVKKFLPVDCMPMNTGSDGLILSSYARDILGDMLLPAGQFLPVRVQSHQYWWFNCLACVNALDAERTDAEWDEIEVKGGSYRWISVPRTLEFQAKVVASAPSLFRVPEFPQGFLFGNEELSRAIVEHELTGFRMDMVWSHIDGGVTNFPAFDFSEACANQAPGAMARKRAQARATLKRRRDRGGR